MVTSHQFFFDDGTFDGGISAKTLFDDVVFDEDVTPRDWTSRGRSSWPISRARMQDRLAGPRAFKSRGQGLQSR